MSTVLITGASSGFGLESAKLFAAKGHNVVATMRNTAAVPELDGLPNVLVTRLDVQDAESIQEALKTAINRFGHIDAVVNNAGFSLWGVFESLPRKKIQEQFDVNVFGVMEVTRAVLPHFRARRKGIIVNVSSGAGVFGLPMISAYNASKFALEGFSESLSYELLSQGIVVKIVEPGGVLDTKFSERLAQEAAEAPAAPDDYAAFIAGTEEVFAGLRANRLATSADVAKVIFDAVTDGTTQLRYVATDDIKPLVEARRSASEAEYSEMMRRKFMPRATG
ncbi:SDR family oxidoreductase [Stenotrophomonas sp. 278]|uniref:SDR family oxidoreductase n=1 Tax=Stenotrophomonas sp. 278 TaxID=2479851 RepID=UPI000F67A239|nr:SDR family oxidoreductase [Stenotrophomonas sp. 278]RRU15254.1 SDR family oxidoreductase [Stenotrophomonas sp. 278]